MGAIRPPARVKLFAGLLSSDEDLFARAAQYLSRMFGEVDLVSPVWPFTHTDYYEPEMGPDLKRRFVSFQRLIRPDEIVAIKRQTNELEKRLAEECAWPWGRPVNIDPGYVGLAKVVLASTKDHAHRLYLGGGIYGEVTLHYAKSKWHAYPWTYPDYASPTYHDFFEAVRQRLKEQLSAW